MPCTWIRPSFKCSHSLPVRDTKPSGQGEDWRAASGDSSSLLSFKTPFLPVSPKYWSYLLRSWSLATHFYLRTSYLVRTMETASLRMLSPNTSMLRTGSTLRALKMAMVATGSTAEIREPKAKLREEAKKLKISVFVFREWVVLRNQKSFTFTDRDPSFFKNAWILRVFSTDYAMLSNAISV